jgi:serine protease AprX
MRKLSCLYVVLIGFLLVSALPSLPLANVIAPEVQTLLSAAQRNAEIPVIITRTNAANVKNLRAPNKALLRSAIVSRLRGQAKLNLVPLVSFLKKNGARQVRELWLTNSVAATLPTTTIQRLATYPGLLSVRLDEVLQLPEAMPAVAAPLEWNISAIGAGGLWELGFTGQGVVVANMDSGVDLNHPDLTGRWRGGTNSWFDAFDTTTTVPRDGYGHGTATMSVMVGGNAGDTAIGVAPGAQWIAARVFDDQGNATTATIHEGFQWLIDPDGDPATDDAPDVINNSWGFRDLVDRCYLEFQTDIQTLKTAGIAVIFSAGNEGPNPSTSISPANNPESFAVGAVDSNLSLAGFSSRGPSACILDNDFFPEVVAPGVNIKVADLTLGLPFAQYTYLDGTSFAAPHVAGGMALLREAFPGLDPAELESALADSAVDLGAVGPDDEYGFGMVDVLAAYRTLVPCTDADGDGYFAETVCGTAQDCDDGDSAVYPGAPEVKHDGIDQDCNGYDLTIEIISAIYHPDSDQLEVIATSDRMGAAHLQVDGFGPMVWNGPLHQWSLVVAPVGGDPGTIVVSGMEGSETAATTVCVDTDGDGFFGNGLCGTLADCDDTDPAVYPGAVEVKHDGIDQDCNGYDLTIEITRSVYRPDTSELEVVATSILADQANLNLDGIGPMIWNAALNHWEIIVSGVTEDPLTVTVLGPEGENTTTTLSCTNTCLADFSDDGVVNFADLALLRANFGTDCSLLPPEQVCVGDANGDGLVNFGDLAQLRSDFGRSDCLVCN